MSTFKKMIRFLKPYYSYLLLALLFAILIIGFHFTFPYIYKLLIDKALTEKNYSMLIKVVIAYFSVTFFVVLFSVLKSIIYRSINEKLVRDGRKNLYLHIRKTELKELEEYKTGNLVSYFINDCPKMFGGLGSTIVEFAQNILRLITSIFILGVIDFKMLLLTLIILPFYLVNANVFNKPIRKTTTQMQNQKSVITDSLQEHLSGTTEIIVFNKTKWDVKRLAQTFSEYIKFAVKNTFWIETSNNVAFMIYWLAVILIYFLGGQRVIAGTMSMGTLFFYSRFIDNIFMPARMLIQQNNNLQSYIAAGKRYFDFIESTDILKKDNNEKVDQVNFKKSIQFQNVDFKYKDKWVLKDINFVIKKGESIAIVGESGSGKSTIIKLLLNLYQPNKGRIIIDELDLKKVHKENLYKDISVIFQEPFLFSDTVYNNIKFACPDSRKKDIYEAAQMAGAHSFIQTLENGYQTIIGERGSNLSGGPKQRIAIARVLLKKSNIYIFDEPTSSLDALNKEIIFQTIERLKEKDKTIIFITHTTKDIKFMDRIFVLDKGKLVAKGTHKKLIETSNKYSNLL